MNQNIFILTMLSKILSRASIILENIIMPIQLNKKIIFLHIPKTAGQSIHNVFQSKISKSKISPINVYDQDRSSFKDSHKYSYFGGHINWDEVDDLFKRDEIFIFTVLRDPQERLASFYLYLKKEAEEFGMKYLKNNNKIGMIHLLNNSIEDYFFPNDIKMKNFIGDMYRDFYVRFFLQKTYRTKIGNFSYISPKQKLKAIKNIMSLDYIGFIENLGPLESKLQSEFKTSFDFSKNKININDMQGSSKWQIFKEMAEKERAGLSDDIKELIINDLHFYEEVKLLTKELI